MAAEFNAIAALADAKAASFRATDWDTAAIRPLLDWIAAWLF